MPQYRASYKLKRLLFTFVLWPFFKYIPFRIGSRARQYLLRFFGAHIARSGLISTGCTISVPWNLNISDRVMIGSGVKLLNLAPIHISSGTVISHNSCLCTGTHDYKSKNFDLVTKQITIGKNCWICSFVFLAPGVTIADDNIIGACSVVTKDTQLCSLNAGNPCRFIKHLSN